MTGDGGPTGVYGNGEHSGVFGFSSEDGSTGVTGIVSEIGTYGNGNTGVNGVGTTTGVYGSGPTGVYGASSNGTGSGVSGVSRQRPRGIRAIRHGLGRGRLWHFKRDRRAGWQRLRLRGWFNGNVNVDGNLSKAGGSFKIDHPLDPANKYLYHSFVESPDMMNIYNGNVTSDGTARPSIDLPEWFEALNRDFRYQLTVIGQFAQAIVLREIA